MVGVEVFLLLLDSMVHLFYSLWPIALFFCLDFGCSAVYCSGWIGSSQSLRLDCSGCFSFLDRHLS